MDIDKVLALYDQYERRETIIPNFQREATAQVVRLVAPAPAPSILVYSQLSAENADAVIRQQIADFTARGRGFEWKLYDHDRPADLQARLAAHGFAIGDAEAIMALDLSALPAVLRQPARLDIRRVTDPEQLGPVASVQEQVWQRDVGNWFGNLATQLRDQPDYASVYVAYVDDRPVCSAWINFPANTPFASLWGGSTLAEYRNRGIYTAMLAVRAQEAVARGYRYLTFDASPMSRPIVAKHGFELLSISHPCEWRMPV
jgi:GNAT superfamily N-acetyltransferase